MIISGCDRPERFSALYGPARGIGATRRRAAAFPCGYDALSGLRRAPRRREGRAPAPRPPADLGICGRWG